MEQRVACSDFERATHGRARNPHTRMLRPAACSVWRVAARQAGGLPQGIRCRAGAARVWHGSMKHTHTLHGPRLALTGCNGALAACLLRIDVAVQPALARTARKSAAHRAERGARVGHDRPLPQPVHATPRARSCLPTDSMTRPCTHTSRPGATAGTLSVPCWQEQVRRCSTPVRTPPAQAARALNTAAHSAPQPKHGYMLIS